MAPPSDSVPRGIRDEKKRVTRHALRLAALRLVQERGLDGTSTDEIAAAVGVSPRTFFNYFPTKESALVGVDPDLAGALLQAVRDRPAGEPPLTVMREVFLQFAPITAGDRDLWVLRIEVARENPVLLSKLFGDSARWDRQVAEAIAERTGRDHHSDPYPALVASVSNAARRSAVHRWAVSDSEAPLGEAIAAAFDLLAAGLPEPPVLAERA